ncbi:uncharacterized protein LOC120942585 [Rana temporaria]|uniref:uncharacterized protein LOC120942585 n=1 Tax=Rana temporaria TaxID=8407 RepID=UPI001AAD2182|nr:uncharacterized protein LOC120942585 [Rana temporaria]
MMKQTIKILGKYLNRLKENDLETFKKMFCKMEPPRKKKKIQNRHLKNQSAAEIAEKIVESYTVRNGPPRVITVLKNMSLNQTSSELQKDLKQARKKHKEKRSNAKVQVAECDKAHLKKNPSQKKSSNVEAQDGVPRSPQIPREVNSRVPKPCSAQEDGRNKMLKPKDNQEEPNNVPRKVDPQITKPDTSQDTSGIPISLTDQNEGKTYITRLEEGQEGTDYKDLKSNIKQEKQESFMEYREIEEFGNTKAIKEFRNSDLQEQNQNRGDPKDDVRIGEGIGEQPKIEAATVKQRKRPAQNRSMGKKQEQGQLKSPTGKLKQTRKAKKGKLFG